MGFIGIDFGTTNTAVVYYDDKAKNIIEVPCRKSDAGVGLRKTLPSAVAFDRDGLPQYVGEAAIASQEAYPRLCVDKVKRLIGKSYEQASQDNLLRNVSFDVVPGNQTAGGQRVLLIRVGEQEKTYRPEEIASLILREARARALENRKLIGDLQNYNFSMPGNYPITLNVTDLRGNWDAHTVTIVVKDRTKPEAHAGPDRVVNEDTAINFDGSESTDNVAPISYTWTFMDVTPKTLTGKNPTHNFSIPGAYTVTLNVTDAAGNSGTDIMTVTVLAVPVPLWEQLWFIATIVLVPATSGFSYLVFWYRRREGLFGQLQRLTRLYVWNKISEEDFEKRLRKLEEKSDHETLERIREYLPHMIAFERGQRAKEEMKSKLNRE